MMLTQTRKSLSLTCVCVDDDGECGARVSLSIQIMICHFQVFSFFLLSSGVFQIFPFKKKKNKTKKKTGKHFLIFFCLFTATCHQLLLGLFSWRRDDNSHTNNNNNNNNNNNEECREK